MNHALTLVGGDGKEIRASTKKGMSGGSSIIALQENTHSKLESEAKKIGQIAPRRSPKTGQ
jgi:hypothetical protein